MKQGSTKKAHHATRWQNREEKGNAERRGIESICNSQSLGLMAVSGEGKSVLSEPGGATRSSLGGGVSVAFAQSTRSLASGRLATQLAMPLLRFADPLDARISADGCVCGVDHDDFIVFVGGILTDPVRVEDAERTDLATDAFLGDGLERALELHLVDTVVSGLAISAALATGFLAGTTADTNAVDDKSLLGAVAQSARLLNTSRLGGTVHARQLTVLPRANAEQKSHHVGLFLPPQFVDIFISAHGWAFNQLKY